MSRYSYTEGNLNVMVRNPVRDGFVLAMWICVVDNPCPAWEMMNVILYIYRERL